MTTDHENADDALARLQQRLDTLVRERPRDEVLDAFAAEAEPLILSLPAEDEARVNRRINCMLAAAGLIPGEPEGEPCVTGDADASKPGDAGRPDRH